MMAGNAPLALHDVEMFEGILRVSGGMMQGGHPQVRPHSLRVFDVVSTRDGRPRPGHFGF